MRIRTPLILLVLLSARLAATAWSVPASDPVPVGAAKIDITPALPIRLTGYESRPTEANRVERPLFARALAIGASDQRPVVVIAVEVLGITEQLADAVARALHTRHGLERSQVALCVTHTHTGPALTGVAPYLFAKDLPTEELARIDAYTTVLQQKLVQVAELALSRRRPGRLAWAEGKVGFAAQRRKVVDGKWTGFGMDPNGLVDHALPVLRATDETGAIVALFASYACHCTTLTGNDNYIHPDWAGDAAARLESSRRDAVALIGIGCGADANPHPRGGIAHVGNHGAALAAEVERLLGDQWRPLPAPPQPTFRRIELALDREITRDELAKRTTDAKKRPSAYTARKLLERIDAGHALPATVPYPVQVWTFGRELAMVFLGGEIVAEYSLRLRRELDGSRLWVNGYSNSVPCYIPSKRMFAEGGYEVDGSMEYYGWPTRLAVGTEDQIIRTVRDLVPAEFHARRVH